MWKYILIIAMFSPTVWARAPECEKSAFASNVEDVWVTTCISTCTKISKIDTQASQDFYRANCESFHHNETREKTIWDLFASGGKILDQWGRCMAGGVYKAVTGIPFLVYDIITAERKGDPNTPFQNPSGQLKTCYAAIDCRRQLARNVVEMMDLPDAEVDKRAATLDVETIMERIENDRSVMQNTCNQRYSDMRMDLLNKAGVWTFELEEELFAKMNSKHIGCVGVLNLQPPKIVAPKPFPECVRDSSNPYAECLNTIEKIAVGVVCAGPEFSKRLDELTVDFCSNVVSILAPVPLIGPQTTWLKPAANAAGAAAKETAVVLKSDLDNQAAAVTQSWDYFAKETLEQRVAFTNAYKEKIFATADDNARFIGITDDPAKLALENKTRIFDSENSVMKSLNDLTRDKNLVTSLTNYQKEILLRNLSTLKDKYPGMQFDVYSDFKSIKISIRNSEKFSPEMSDALLADLNAMYAQTNEEFAKKMAELGIAVPPAGDPSTWMRAGYGRNVDEAALAARRARGQADGANQVMDFYSPEVREQMSMRLAEVEAMRVELSLSPKYRSLFEATPSGASFPKQEVFDFVRKSKTNEELAAAIRQRYGLSDFTVDDAVRLRDYARGVDEFSPTLLIGKRENVNLDEAINGGASADFLGMGSANLRATAEGISGKPDLVTALRGARDGEIAVTKTFQQRMATFRRIVGGTVKCSGDDCVRIASTAMTNPQKHAMLNRLATNKDTQAIRMAFVSEGVPQQFRMQIASQGESIEKALRTELAKLKFPAEKAGRMTFGLDMQTVNVNQGTVNLIVGKSGSMSLNPAEQGIMQEAFRNALVYVNRSRSTYVQGTTQMTDNTLFLVPGLGLPNVFNEEGR